MGDAGRIVIFFVGLAVVLGTAVNVFMSLVVPRSHYSRLRRAITRLSLALVRPVLPRLKNYESRDRVMSVVGPLALILLFISWLVLVVVGFGLMLWWVTGETLAHSFAISGSSVFTLGVATGPHPGTTFVEFVAAGTGLLIIAMEIAYLPAMYAAFAAREAEVTLLAPRAGWPAWGPEILARHHWFRTEAELPELYGSWERWAAGVAESHSNYPPLMWFRSPVYNRSWLLSLAAMLDAAALQDALNPGTAPRQARIFLMMGVDCLRSLARTLRIPYDPDPKPSDPIRLTYEEFADGLRRLDEVEYEAERTPEEAWRHFAGWRVGYEPIVDALTELIVAPPAPWLVDRPEIGPSVHPGVRNRTPDDPEGQPAGWRKKRPAPPSGPATPAADEPSA
ncbi:MAG TPA: hypothetical protein VK277_13940 [Acidimicrobiales bacterium]|nr:hypothetical protein [Acidimicrobiales bacterium]